MPYGFRRNCREFKFKGPERQTNKLLKIVNTKEFEFVLAPHQLVWEYNREQEFIPGRLICQ
jgi:hypothetical protein